MNRQAAIAQSLTPEAIEQHERAVFKAWDEHDSVKLAELNAMGGVGFGFRTRDPRHIPDEKSIAVIEAFFDSCVYFRSVLDEIHTAVSGDLGLAWGFYTEEFQAKGRHPERIRARFSDVWRRDDSGWHLVAYHRDAQTFDASGRHVPVPVS